MQHNFFISHYHGDMDIAELIARTLRRISLNQLNPWFSSDTSEYGGIKAGERWFIEIMNKLSESRALIVLLTPNSIENHWLYFESGVAEAVKNCSIIPVCIGIKRENINPPLGLYQCYQLSDYRSLKEFINKVVAKFDISFDEEMAQPVLEVMLKELSMKSFENFHANEKPEASLLQVINEIKEHFDKSHISLIDRLKSNFVSENRSDVQDPIAGPTYTITLHIKFPEHQATQFVEIRPKDSVGNVIDSIFFLVSKFVPPFTYLEKWILRNAKTKSFLIIAEMEDLVSANNIFSLSSEWIVLPIDEPYSVGKPLIILSDD